MAELESLLSGLLDDPDISGKLRSLISKDEKEPAADAVDPALMLKMTKALGSLKKSGDDPRSRLLCDLKPYISPARCKRVDEAVNILRIMSAVDIIKDEF